MSEERDEKAIQTEIAELERIKPLIPQRTAFGDSNWDKVEAQIEVLRERLSDVDIDNRTYTPVDEDTGEEIGEPDWTMEQGSSAREALEWMYGESDEKPSEGWQSLIGVKPKFDFRGLGPKEATAMLTAAKHQGELDNTYPLPKKSTKAPMTKAPARKLWKLPKVKKPKKGKK